MKRMLKFSIRMILDLSSHRDVFLGPVSQFSFALLFLMNNCFWFGNVALSLLLPLLWRVPWGFEKLLFLSSPPLCYHSTHLRQCLSHTRRVSERGLLLSPSLLY